MVVFVLIANLLLALLCLFTAWQMLRLRRYLAKVTETLTAVERSTHNVLYRAPEFILTGQWGTRQLRQQYQALQPQFQQLQQTLTLLNLGFALWQRSLKTQNFPKSSKSRKL